jgi:hypothetical protein
MREVSAGIPERLCSVHGNREGAGVQIDQRITALA